MVGAVRSVFAGGATISRTGARAAIERNPVKFRALVLELKRVLDEPNPMTSLDEPPKNSPST
jgi:hypothetical protein